MTKRNSKVTEKRPSANAKAISLTVVRRPQAPEDEHRLLAAIDALLMELVRQRLRRKGN
jgi:hypothetical protein